MTLEVSIFVLDITDKPEVDKSADSNCCPQYKFQVT